MCVPCGNSLKILGNVYVRGSASWGVIEEDLSGASSARVRFSVGIAAAHVRFFEASYVRRSDVFSCKTLSLGKPSGQVHWYHWWPFAMPWPGHCCQWFDRTGCLHSRLPRERCEACLSASQTITNLWHCHWIPKGRKRHEHIIWTWCFLPFPATSVLFLVRFTISLVFERTAPPPSPPPPPSPSWSSSSSSHCLNHHHLFYHLLEDHPTSIIGKQNIFISELHKTVISLEVSQNWDPQVTIGPSNKAETSSLNM